MIKPESQPMLISALAAAGPALLLVWGLAPSSLLNRNGGRTARVGALSALFAGVCAVLAVTGFARFGVARASVEIVGPLQAGVYFDGLSAIMLALVSFLLVVVTRFSVNYLAGDPRQGTFTKWLCMTGGCVSALVISANLAQFAIAWSATSLCLHKLLVFYPDRPGAALAARKKFLISRVGDACLAGVILLVYWKFHTWEFALLFEAAGKLHFAVPQGERLLVNAVGFLLVAGAMLKSAQFPFHSWLPDTMETPTPVSALMHAGIINAGGFLVLRMSPLLTLSPAALSILALVGAFTALFASLVMLTHASVKRALAFSTVAQMGYMMLECGLGAFPLALLHLVAHSLYKAYAFLSSGSVVRSGQNSGTRDTLPVARPATILGAIGLAMCLTLLGALVFKVDLLHEPGMPVLGSALAMAIAYGLCAYWGPSPKLGTVLLGGVAGAGVIAINFALHLGLGRVMPAPGGEWAGMQFWPGALVAAVLIALFLIMLIVQAELPAWAGSARFQALYVHARNGFYFNTLANRLVAALGPVKSQPKGIQ